MALAGSSFGSTSRALLRGSRPPALAPASLAFSLTDLGNSSRAGLERMMPPQLLLILLATVMHEAGMQLVTLLKTSADESAPDESTIIARADHSSCLMSAECPTRPLGVCFFNVENNVETLYTTRWVAITTASRLAIKLDDGIALGKLERPPPSQVRSTLRTARTTVSLDFGWRVHAAPLLACTYPVSIPGVIQTGGWLVDNVTSTAGCAAAACAANAQAWSFCAGGCGEPSLDPWHFWPLQTVLPPPKCVLGNTGQLRSTNSSSLQNWTSMARRRGAPLAADTPEASKGFDDSAWRVVDLPHDASIDHGYTPAAAHGKAFVTNIQMLYRKHIALPVAFRGRAITLEVDGALMDSSWWVNGVQVVALKTDGYLPLTLRLDTLVGVELKYGRGEVNVIVAWTDNSATTGWWYEGSGLARHARLVVAPAAARLRPFAIAAPAVVTAASVKGRSHPAQGLTGAAVVSPSADISIASPSHGKELSLTFVLVGNNGVVAARTMVKQISSGGITTIAAPPMHLDAELWSVARPYLYTLVTTLAIGGSKEVDAVNTTVGIRGIEWDPGGGLHLNGRVTKMRGFCNHESFTGIGAAIPPRVDLLRVQQMRGLGGNAWRTSHNPPEPALLDIADRLGVLVLDENRVFATTANCPADYTDPNHTCTHGYLPDDPGDVPDEVGKLALRDRNHASVIWYSLCNEAGCGPGTLLKDGTGQKCQEAIHAVDKSRAITGNMYSMQGEAVAPGTPISKMVDVMGMSHQPSSALETWHVAEPDKLVVATEVSPLSPVSSSVLPFHRICN